MQHIDQTSASAGPRCVTPSKEFVAGRSENGDICHLIIEGALASYHLLPDGKEQISAYYLPGDVCGLSSFSRLGRDDNMLAITPTVTARIPLASLIDLAEGSPAIGRALLRQMSVETAIARQWIVNIGQRSAFLRIAHLACELESRLGAVGLVKDSCFRWFGTQKDLASATGLSVVHVNRSLQKLSAERLVEWKTTHVRILDTARLWALVEFDPRYLSLGEPTLGDLLLGGDHSIMRRDFSGGHRSENGQGGTLSAVNDS